MQIAVNRVFCSEPEGRAFGGFILYGRLPPSPTHLGSHRNLVFSPSSLQISHSLKEGWTNILVPSLLLTRKTDRLSTRCWKSSQSRVPCSHQNKVSLIFQPSSPVFFTTLCPKWLLSSCINGQCCCQLWYIWNSIVCILPYQETATLCGYSCMLSTLSKAIFGIQPYNWKVLRFSLTEQLKG